jgi:hypothetical protein
MTTSGSANPTSSTVRDRGPRSLASATSWHGRAPSRSSRSSARSTRTTRAEERAGRTLGAPRRAPRRRRSDVQRRRQHRDRPFRRPQVCAQAPSALRTASLRSARDDGRTQRALRTGVDAVTAQPGDEVTGGEGRRLRASPAGRAASDFPARSQSAGCRRTAVCADRAAHESRRGGTRRERSSMFTPGGSIDSCGSADDEPTRTPRLLAVRSDTGDLGVDARAPSRDPRVTRSPPSTTRSGRAGYRGARDRERVERRQRDCRLAQAASSAGSTL